MIQHYQTSGLDNYSWRSRWRCGWAIAAAVALVFSTAGTLPISAQEFNGNVVAGSASIDQGATRTTITAANNTIIDFPTFNIPAGYTVQFIQPSDTSRVLNRVTGGNPSELFGSLQANGIVYLANPAGIYFGPNSFIDVGALYAAAGNLSNRDFLDQSDRFTGLNGSVVNAGVIQGRSIHLLGQTVSNLGVIDAPEGVVVMAAGDDVYVGEKWGRVFVHATRTAADSSTASSGVNNTGAINAYGGQALLAAGDLYSVAIQQSGIIIARSVALEGQGGGEVWNSGRIDASSTAAGAVGGHVQITGEKVGLAAGSTINASGAAGGGTIFVGGDFQGGNSAIRNATMTRVGADATLRADATDSGDGGRVIVWSDDGTRFYGNVSVQGGPATGDGGFVEVSGKGYLDFSGRVDLSASRGMAGSLLLDPRNLTIDNSSSNTNTDGAGSSGDPFEPDGDNSVLNWATIKTALGTGNVFVTTSGTGTSDPGNITIGASPTGGYNFSNNLTLTTASAGGIILNAAITNSGSGDLVFNAGSAGITLGASLSFATGTITFNHSGALTQSSGTVTANSLVLSGGGGVASGGDPLEVDVGALRFATKTAGSTSISNTHAGAMTISGSTGGALALTATNAITQGGSAVEIAGSATFKTLKDDGAAITLSHADNAFSSVSAEVRNAADDANATATITVVESGSTQLGRVRTEGNLNVTSTGVITQAATATVGGTATFKTLDDAGAAISIDDAGNAFGVFAASVREADDGASADGDISVRESDSTALGLIRTTGALNVISGGAISQSGGASATASAGSFKTLNETGAPITLGSSGNSFGAFTAQVRNAADDAGKTAAITLVNTGPLALGTITTGGTLDITSTGAITQSASSQIGGAAAFRTVNSAGAAITLDDNANTFGSTSVQVLDADGNAGPSSPIVLRESGAMTLASAQTAGNLTVFATGAITQTGAAVVGGAASFSTRGSGGPAITLSQSGNKFGSITATGRDDFGAIAAMNLTIVESDSTLLAGVTTNGNFSVTSAGSISQSGLLDITGTSMFTVSAASSNLLLATSDNDFTGAVSFVTSGSGSYNHIAFRNMAVGASAPGLPASLHDLTLQFPNAAIVVPTLTLTGSLSVLAGGAITDADGTSISVSGLATFNAGSNAITIGDFGADVTNFGSLSATGGTVSIAEDSAAVLAGISASTLNLTVSGNITQSGGTTVIVSGPTVFTVLNGSDLVLQEDNSFSGTLGFNTLTGSYHDLAFRNISAAPGALTFGAAVTGDLAATFTASAVALPSLSVGGNLTVNANGISNTVGATLAVTGQADFNAGANSVTLGQNPADTLNFGSLSFTGNAVTISEDSAMSLGASSGGIVALTANGSLTQTGVLTATGATTSLTVGPGADLLMGTLANDVRGAVSFAVTGGGAMQDLQFRTVSNTASVGSALPTTPRNLSLVFDAAPLTLSTLSPTGSVTAVSGGLLTVGGNIVTSDRNVSLTGSSIRLPSAFSLTTGGGAVALNGAVQTSGSASISTAGGDLSFSSTINDLVASTSVITLNAGAGEVALNGAVGTSVAINSLSATGSAIRLGSVTSTGLQTYVGPVTLLGHAVLNGSGLSFSSTLSGGGFDLTLTSSLAKSLSAGFSGIRNLTASGAGSTQLGGAFTTSGSQTYNSPVTLSGDTALSATTFTFNGAVTGASHDLVLNHAIATTLDLSKFTGLSSFAVGSSAVSPVPAPTTTVGGTMSTTGNTVFGNPVVLSGSTSLSGSLVNFLSTIDGGQTLAITGPATFAGSIGGTTPLTSLSVSGATILNGAASLVKTTAGQTFLSTVTLNTSTELESGSGAVVGALTGNNNNLAITAAGTVTVNSSFSGLNSLNVTAPLANISGAITTIGGQTFDSDVNLVGDTTLTSSTDQNIAITGTVNGARNLTINVGATATPGTVTFGGDVGSTNQPVNLTVTGAGKTKFDGELVNTSGNQTYGGLVTAAPSGGTITFDGLTGTFSSGLDAAGVNVTLQFTDLIYQASGFSIGTLAVTTTSKAQILGASPLVTTGAQTYTGPVELANGTAMTGAAMTFNHTLKLLGASNLTATGGGIILAGAFTSAGTANLTATGAITFGNTAAFAGDATLDAGSATFAGVVTLGTGRLLDITAANTTFNGRVLGPGGLAIDGNVRFNGFVGYNETAPFDALSSLNVTGNTTVAGEAGAGFGTVFATGAETFGGQVTILGETYLDATSVTFNGALEGPGALLTVDSTTTIVFNGSVGGTTPLSFLSIGPATINSSLVRTTLDQTYLAVVTLGANVTLTAGGSLSLVSVQGANNLTLNVTGSTSIGSVNALGSGTGAAITIGSGGNTTFNGAVSTASGIVQTSNSAVTFVGNVTLGAGDSDSVFNGSVILDGAQFLSGGAITFGDAASDALTIGNPAGVTLTTAAAGENLAINAATLLNGGLTIETGAGAVSLGLIDGAQALTVVSTGGITFGDAIGATTALTGLTLNGGSQLNGATVRTSGSQLYNGAVNLGSDLVVSVLDAAPAHITFAGAVDGNHALTLITPTANFSGAVGSATPLSSLTVTAGVTNITGSGIATSGSQDYFGPVEMGDGADLSGSDLIFNGALELLGSSELKANAGELTFIQTFRSAGTSSLSATGAISFGSTAAFNGDANLNAGTTATLGGVVSLGAGKLLDITATDTSFADRVLGPGGLAVHGDVRFNGFVGFNGTAPFDALSSLDITGNTIVASEAGAGFGAIYATGAEIFGGQVTLLGETYLDASGVTFNGVLEGPGSLLTLNSTMPIVFNGPVGNTSPLSFLSIGPAIINGGSVRTTLSQAYLGPLTLGANASLTAGSLNLVSLQGSHNLTLNVTGVTSIDSVTAFGSGIGAAITIESAGNTTFNGLVSTASGIVQTSDSSVTFAGDVAIGGGNFDSAFNGSVILGGAQFLSGGAIAFGDAASDTLTIDNPSGVTVTTAAAGKSLAINAATLLKGALAIDTGAGAVSLGMIDGAQALTVTSTGGITFGDAIGATTALTDLTLNGGSQLNGPTVRTSGSQLYNGAVNLGSDLALSVLDGAPAHITFVGAVDGDHALTLSAPIANFSGAVGSTTPLSSLTMIAGSTNITGAQIATFGNQVYSGRVYLGATTHLITGLGSAQFGSLVDGPGALIITGNASFADAVGSAAPLASLTITGAAALDGSTIQTTGNQRYSGTTSFAGDLHLSGQKITIDNAIDSSSGLTITGDAAFDGSIGQVTPLSFLAVSGHTELQGGSVTTAGTQLYSGDVALNGSTTLTGSLITIEGGVDGDAVFIIAGDAAFAGVIGDFIPLSSLLVNGTTTLTGARITTSTTQTYSGPIVLGGDTTLKGSLITVGGSVDGSLALTIDGDAVLNGLIGQSTPLSALTVLGSTALNSGLVSTTGVQTYGGATIVGANAKLVGSAINFVGTIDGPFDLLTTGATTFNGAVGSATSLTSLSVNGPAIFNTASITTTGNQMYAGAAMLTFDTVLTSGTSVAFSGTLDGSNALTVDADATFAGAVGASTALTSLSISGDTGLNGATVHTTGGQTYGGATTLGGNSTLTGTLMTFGATLDGPYALTVAGSGSFGGPVGGLAALQSLSVSGASSLNAATIDTLGAQSYTGALTLTADSILTGSSVYFGGPLAGPFALTIEGSAIFSSTVGSGVPLGSLRVAGSSTLNGARVSTLGAQVYSGPTVLGGDAVLSGTTITFGSNVNGPFVLTINGLADFGGSVGGSVPLAALTLMGPVTLKAGAINTTGAQTYEGAVQLTSDNTLNASVIRFLDTVDGPFALTIPRDVAFGGMVGGVQPLAALNVGGSVSLDGATIKTSGPQTYGGSMVLNSDSVVTASLVGFGGTINGFGSLTINGSAEFADNIGDDTPLTELTVTGDTTLEGSRVTTVSLQSYGGSLTLSKDAILSSAQLAFGGAIDGASALILNGATTLAGLVGKVVPLTSLHINGATALNSGVITTVETQTFNGNVSLGADATLSGTLATFAGTLDGAHGLSIVGAASFEAAVGQTAALASLEVSEEASLGGGSYTTTGGQHYGGAVELGANTLLTADGVVFDAALNGGFSLTINEYAVAGTNPQSAALHGNTVTFGGEVGSLQALTSLLVNGSSIIDAAAVSTSGAQTWNGTVSLSSDVTLTAMKVTFGQEVDGGNNLDIVGDVVLSGVVGGISPLASLVISGTTQFDAASITTSGAQNYTGAVQLGSDLVIAATDGNVTFEGTVSSASNRALTVTAPTGYVAFSSGIGLGGGTLRSFSVEANDMEIAEVHTLEDQTYVSAAGAVTMLTGNLLSENGSIGFSSRRSEVPVIATIFKNTPGDLVIEAPKGDFSMTSYERFLVSGGRTSADVGGNLTLRVGGRASLGDFAVSKFLSVRASAIDFQGTYLQATDIALLTPQGTLMPVSSMTFRNAPAGSSSHQVSLSTRNATPFAPTLTELIFRRLDPALFSDNRIAPEKFPLLSGTGSILFPEFNVFPVFAASSRVSLAEVLSGATPVATAEVAQVATISSAVRDQLVLLGIFARRLTSEEEAARRENRTLYAQIIPTEAREPDMFQVADGRISQDGAVKAVRLYEKIFMTRNDSGAPTSRIPEIQHSLATAFQAFRRVHPNAEPSAFATFLQTEPGVAGATDVQRFVKDAAELFRTIESLGLTDQEIAVSKTVLLRPLRVVGLPSGTIRRMIEALNTPAIPTASLASVSYP